MQGQKGAVPDDFIAAVIDELESQNPRLAAALESARLHQSDSQMDFYVPESYFRMMRLDAKDQLELETLLQRKLGGQVRVQLHRGEPPAEEGAVKVATPETLVGKDPIVQEFVKTFKGKINKIELMKGSRA